MFLLIRPKGQREEEVYQICSDSLTQRKVGYKQGRLNLEKAAHVRNMLMDVRCETENYREDMDKQTGFR